MVKLLIGIFLLFYDAEIFRDQVHSGIFVISVISDIGKASVRLTQEQILVKVSIKIAEIKLAPCKAAGIDQTMPAFNKPVIAGLPTVVQLQVRLRPEGRGKSEQPEK